MSSDKQTQFSSGFVLLVFSCFFATGGAGLIYEIIWNRMLALLMGNTSYALATLLARTETLQQFRDFTVVFAAVGDIYEVRMLELGRQTPEWSEVLGGLEPGEIYVSENSYLIKADIEKSGASMITSDVRSRRADDA